VVIRVEELRNVTKFLSQYWRDAVLASTEQKPDALLLEEILVFRRGGLFRPVYVKLYFKILLIF
jgi:hypothetical protein